MAKQYQVVDWRKMNRHVAMWCEKLSVNGIANAYSAWLQTFGRTNPPPMGFASDGVMRFLWKKGETEFLLPGDLGAEDEGLKSLAGIAKGALQTCEPLPRLFIDFGDKDREAAEETRLRIQKVMRLPSLDSIPGLCLKAQWQGGRWQPIATQGCFTYIPSDETANNVRTRLNNLGLVFDREICGVVVSGNGGHDMVWFKAT